MEEPFVLGILGTDDASKFASLIKIFREVFEHEDSEAPAEQYLKSLLEKSDFLALVATHKGEIVGGLTVYLLQGYYDTKPIAYIYDVGVRPDFQRKGVGQALIDFMLRYCKSNGIEEMYVAAEADDEPALGFYHKTNFDNVLDVKHFVYEV
jgi:aminoglycoside 3-N-acetyltransferase I